MNIKYQVNLTDYTVTFTTNNDPFVKKMNGIRFGIVGLKIVESYLLENYRIVLVIDKIIEKENSYLMTFNEMVL